MLDRLFKKNKSKKPTSGAVERVVKMKPLDYPPKIIVAWAKAVEGETQFGDWLKNNGYEELNAACAAIRLNETARVWLMNNGYPHLLAFIQAAESNKKACEWLEKHSFHLLLQMAKGIDGDHDALDWVKNNQSVDIFILTMAIKKVKDQIEDLNNDPHVFK